MNRGQVCFRRRIWLTRSLPAGNRKGYAFIGNLPPNTHGVLDDAIVAMAHSVGDSIRSFWASSLGETQGACSGGDDTVTLKLKAAAVKTVALSEDLSAGQKVAGYTLEVRTAAGGWKAVGTRETIGMQFLHEVGQTVDAVRVRCECTAGVLRVCCGIAAGVLRVCGVLRACYGRTTGTLRVR